MVVVHQDCSLKIAEYSVRYHHRIEQESGVARPSLLVYGCHRQVVDSQVHSAVHVSRLGVEVLLALTVLESVGDVLVAEVVSHVSESEG